MLSYYLQLAWRSLRRYKTLTVLMVLAIAVGIGTSMTTLTVLHVLSGDPIPAKSGKLFRVRINTFPDDRFQPTDKTPDNLTRRDATALLGDARGDHQAVMSAGSGVLITPQGEPMRAQARYTTADFFPMFNVPMRYGRAWNGQADTAHARVAVISSQLNDLLFGDQSGVGKTLQFGDASLRIVGVLGSWDMNPRFYDLSNGEYGDSEQVFVPLSTALDLHLGTSGTMNCWGNAKDAHDLDAPCIWLQYWVELDSPAKVAAYQRYLHNYMALQQQAGRFRHPAQVRLQNVMQWLDYKGVVPADVRMQVWLAFGFLMICLLNTVGLLLAKFLRRGGEIGVRRALGASRRDVFMQYLIESLVIGMVGGLLGLVLAYAGVALVRQQPTEYAAFVHMDLGILLMTLLLALVASLVAGLLPAWRAMQIQPARALKAY
ncbi:ABC transporter permease [Oleiagrimonas sp. C23AA]|uniref:ABC transporter permease n=1 Tax=Oleiagrimonas sp. C23AA TaxID=2719047 RepID=UPI00142464C7|nr:ABC transporter permease [Oleiagrimonas sp. C23AA]NII12037.1 FtsX-like permease family protein [Oleiagrimonas sp. C23AA]